MMVDIYIREKSGTREIRIPLIPEKLPFPRGDATFITYDIMELGEVAVPSGTELGSYSWKSEFPGELRQNDPMIRGSWMHPNTYDSILQDWQEKGTELNLLVTGYPINADVYLKEYHSEASGAFGDVSYEIAFINARSIVVTSTTTTTRPATTSSTYVIKSGDTLWGIAKKFYGTGTKWTTIYNANKEIIESTAKARWKAVGINRDSENGHWIFPGVKLTIPGVTGSGSGGGSTSSGSGTGSTSTGNTNNTPGSAATASAAKAEAYLTKRNTTINKYAETLKPSGGSGGTIKQSYLKA